MGDGSRDTTSASFVGSVQVFSEAPGVIYTRARLLGAVVNNLPGDKTRKVTFWTNCEADGALLDVDVNYPGSVAHSVENDFSTQVTAGTPSIRDICSLTEETTSSSDLKNIIKNIKGDASVAAVKVYKGTKDGSGNPQWSACGYLKLPEQVSLHFKKLHAEDVDDHVLMLDH